MKHKTKTITAITTLMNGHIKYISGQSIRDNGSLLPQLDADAQKAKEFNSTGGAAEYLKKVFNPFHRMFTIVTIDILDIPATPLLIVCDESKLDKKTIIEKVKALDRIAIVLIIAATIITSCSKAQTLPAKQSAPLYQLYIEQYTLDSAFVKKYIWWQDTVSRPSEQIKIDTLHPRWFRICGADLKPTHLEYTYYTRNGIKIQ